MSDVLATSFGVLNYSGMLFNKGNTRTPLSAIIGSRAKQTNHVEFVTGQEYTTGGGSQPNISETASLTAPNASVVTREQKTNVTQIFQEAVGVSYAKQSNMGTLSGLNVAGQQANPIRELDFQVAAKMVKVNRDIEFTFIQGQYNKATSDSEVNKTRGLVAAITSNVLAMNGKSLGLWDVADLMKTVYEANAPTEGLVLWCDAVTMFQINADAVQNGLTVIPAARDINGIKLSKVVTPLGEVYLYAKDILSNMADTRVNIEDTHEQMEFRRRGYELLRKHLDMLPERDREILKARRLSDPAATLETLSKKYKISRERVRQIEERAFNKLRDAILNESNSKPKLIQDN